MIKIYKFLFIVLLFSGIAVNSFSQNGFFKEVSEAGLAGKVTGKRVTFPQKFATYQLNPASLKAFLWSLPSQNLVADRNTTPIMEIPMPDGRLAKFHVWERTVQDPALAAKFPDIKTFIGQGIDDPYANIAMDWNPTWGFSGQILSVNGRVFIDPYSRGDVNYYMSFYATDAQPGHRFNCLTHHDDNYAPSFSNFTAAGPCRGTQLMTYRLAQACTGEYAVAVGGGTAAGTHAAIVTAINRINQVYETEFSVHMNLVANNNLIEYLNPATDPYLNDANNDLDTNTPNVNSVIGAANYDYGHLFCTTDGGVAYLESVCSTFGAADGIGGKAGGLTGLPNPIGDDFYIDYVAHEMGHQFGGDHTFNSTTGSCGGGNREPTAAYEVGSATTIMGYAGICGANDIQPHSDPYFHTYSFDQASTHISGAGGCGVITATGNTLPVITAMDNNGVTIPPSTPFTLTGAATDANGDALTYNWEEWDLGTAGAWNNGAASTTAPLFKSRIPKTTGSRTFPDIAVILANYPTAPGATMGGLKGETLPTVARAMKFRLTVRDNRAGGGGVVTGGNGCGSFNGTFQINVSGTSPFAVTVPNGGESYAGGSAQTVTWNVVGTNAAPFNVTNVKISLSTDGGNTYPTVLLASTANDGSESVTMPAISTTTARIKVEALSNVFFDISNANFTLTAPANDFAFGTSAASTTSCPSTNPTVTIPTTVTGTPGNITLTATTGVPGGTSVTFAPNPLTPGNSAVATLNNANTLAPGNYVITVQGVAGAITHTTTITYIITAGAAPVITTQPTNQSVCAPATATFTVATSTSGVSYQWQSAPTVTGTYTNIAGATSATYTTGATSAAMNGTAYHVILTTVCGTVTSSNAVLTVNSAASIATQPTNQSACTGNTATFTVTAAGSNVTYQWQSATAAAGPFSNVTTGTGGTTATYTTGTLTAGSDGFYRVIVNSTSCAGAVTSNVVTLTIGTTVSITTQPTNQTVCAPATATFSVVAAGTSINYQWQSAPTVTGTYTNIAGATSATYTTPATTTAQNGTAYHVVITGTCNTVTSNNVVLTVNAAAAIATQPTNQAVCTGNTATFTIGATGTGVTYQWQSSAAAAGPFTNVTTGTGGTTASYTTAAVTAGTDGFYQVIINSPSCPGAVTSNVVTLTIGTTVSIGTQPVNQTVCAPATATFSVTTTGTVTGYQWQSAPTVTGTYTNIAGATSATYTTPATTVAQSGTAYHVVITGRCNTVTSNNVVLTVNAPAVITTQPTNQSACTGNTATFTVAATGTGVTYQWQSGSSAAGPWTNVTTGTGGTSATYTTATITGTTPTWYQVLVSSTLCPATLTSNAVQLTINTTTSITTAPAAQIVCAPATATFSVTSAGTGNGYQWQSGPSATGPFTNVAGATSASYTTPATTAAMSGTFYQVVITGSCNNVTTTPVQLTVNTTAAITTQPLAQVVCSGSTATFVSAASGTGVTYQWQSGPSATGPFTNIGGATSASYTTPATTSGMNGTFYRVVVTTTTCAGTVNSTAVLLTVNTVATITTQPTSQSACVPTAVTFTVAATGTGLSYQWQVSTNGGATFTDIGGATSAAYTINPTTVAMNGNQYHVNVYSTCSPATPITSANVTLSTNNPVAVTQNPVAQGGCAGDNFTFSVTATGAGLTYQWQVSTNGGGSYTNIPGATSATYTVTNASQSQSGYLYRVIVSGGTCGIVTTPGAALTLSTKPVVVITAVVASTQNLPSNTIITATVSPVGNYVYAWYLNGVLIPNTLASAVIPITVSTGNYQVKVTDVASGCSSLSNMIAAESVLNMNLTGSHLFIYPNPVSTIMDVRFYGADPSTRGTTINIYDSKGARVMTKSFTITATYGSMQVDMSKMIGGTYMVEVRDAAGKKLADAKVVKNQ